MKCIIDFFYWNCFFPKWLYIKKYKTPYALSGNVFFFKFPAQNFKIIGALYLYTIKLLNMEKIQSLRPLSCFVV